MGRRQQREGLAEAATKAGHQLIAVIYNRVSSDRDGEKRSTGEQDDDNRDRCDRNHWTIGATYTDDDRSASRFATKDRTQWELLSGRLAQGHFHVLVLWEVSRGDRRLKGWIGLLETCRELGVFIHVTSHDHTYDVRKWRDYKTLAEEGIDASGESEKTSDRILRDVRAQAKKGRPHGILTYGYKRTYKVAPNGKRKLIAQIPDEDPRTAFAMACFKRTAFIPLHRYSHAEVIRGIAKSVESGKSLREIAKSLNSKGIPSPRKSGLWEGNAIRQMAINRAYVGRRTYRGEDIGPADWDPLIEQATYNACVIRLTDPARARKHDSAIKHLLSGIAECGICGVPVRTLKKPGYRVYTCVSKGRVQSVHVVRHQDRVEGYVLTALFHRLSDPDLLNLLAEDTAADEQLVSLAAQASDLEIRLNEARDAFTQGSIPMSALTRIEGTLGPQIDQLRASMRRSRIGPVLEGLIQSTPEKVEKAWATKTISQQRAAIRAVIDHIVILKLGKIGRTPYTPEESVRIDWRRPASRL